MSCKGAWFTKYWLFCTFGSKINCKVRKYFYVAFLCAAACSQPEKKVVPGMEAEPAGATTKLLSDKFKTGRTLPFKADTALFFHLEGGDSLTGTDVRALAGSWFKHDLVSNVQYEFAEFYKIDSLKATGGYPSYVDSLDIGQTKDSKAYAVCRLAYDSVTTLLVWALTASSYEACPYFSGQTVYFTVLHNGKIQESFLLGAYESAGDPPVSMERTVNGRINPDLTIELSVVAEHDEDMDQPELEITREEYKFAVKEGHISLVSEAKQPVEKVKRKPAT